MTSRELVRTLMARGVRFRQEGGSLRVDAPAGVLTPSLQDEIRQNRTELIAFLGEAASGMNDGGAPRLLPGAAGEAPWRLSPSQERLWFLDRIDSSGGTYNLPGAWRFQGPLDASVLETALSAFVARHAILNVRFVQRDGIPVMEPSPETIRWEPGPRVDLTGMPPTEREPELIRLLEEWAEEHFDLEEGELFRARLVTLGPEDHALFVLSHSVVWDGWCYDLLLQDLHQLYPAIAAGRSDEATGPAEPAIEYVDYAAWQRARLESGSLDGDVAWWSELLTDLPVPVDLPTDRPRPPATFAGGRLHFRFDGKILARLTEVGRQDGATPFMVLLAAYAVLLHRGAWRDDLLILVPVRGRLRPELETVLGTFTQHLPLRVGVTSDLSFRDHLRTVRRQVLASLDHQSAPLEAVIESNGALRGGEGAPELYRSVFSYQNAAGRPRTIGPASIRNITRGHGRVHSDMSVGVREHQGYLDGTLDYRSDLFDATTASRFLDHFHAVLQEVTDDPDRRLGDLLSTDDDLWASAAPAPEIEAERGVVRVPDEVALRQPGRTVTWDELDRRAAALARDLREVGVFPGVPVACIGAADVNAIIGFLGIMRAGATLIPLPVETSASRSRTLLEATGVRHVVASGGVSFSDHGRNLTVLDIPDPEMGSSSAEPWMRGAGGPGPTDHPGRVILVDADARGEPVPVPIPGTAVATAIRHVAREVGLGEDRTVLVSGSLGRAGTVHQLLAALTSGARVTCLGTPSADDEWEVADLLAERPVDVAFLTTPLATRLLATDWTGTPELTLVCEGPRPSAQVIDALRARVGGLWWLDGYAEAGAWSFLERLDGAPGTTPGIGLVPPASVKLAGPGGRSVALGMPGRMLMKRPGAEEGEPPLDTGELARWVGPQGEAVEKLRLHRIRRRDDRVWSGGSLVDPREAEAALLRFPEVEDASVSSRVAPGGEERLVAYLVVGAEHPTPTTADVRSRLGDQLPDALLPHLVLRVEEIPRKPDGAVDHAALPDPFDRGSRGSTTGIESGSDEERLVAEVWTEVLGREATGTEDNFFQLGGHSLLLLPVIARIEERSGVRMDPRVFFYHSLGGVAHALAEAQRGARS